MELFVIGKIVKFCGLSGRVKVMSYLESKDTLHSLDEVYVRQGKDETGPFKLQGIQIRGKSVFLKMEGVEDTERAKMFIGCQVLIPVDKLKILPGDEYYWRDIIGLRVVSEDGQFLGLIEAIMPTGSNDVYVCRGGEREILLPSIADVIRKIDIDQGLMIVRLLEGL